MSYCIVWEFDKAPQELQDLSTNGGDEDWLAEIPPDFNGGYLPSWIESSSFGCCDIAEYPHPKKGGWKIVIGSHA